VQLAAGLSLYDQFLVHDHVQSLLRELMPLVKHGYGDLPRHSMFALYKLPLQSHNVDVLEESKTECVVNLEERPDHRVSESCFKELAMRHPLKMVGQTTQKTSYSPTRR
jgi:hypothetical protein